MHTPTHPVRIVTASALFDGHDASINIMRRIFMSQGCEVIHLGHNRSVQEVVDAALEEDVQGVAVGLRVDGHGGDAELVERADHAHRDLAPVGDQDLLQRSRLRHVRQRIARPAPGRPRLGRGRPKALPERLARP